MKMPADKNGIILAALIFVPVICILLFFNAEDTVKKDSSLNHDGVSNAVILNERKSGHTVTIPSKFLGSWVSGVYATRKHDRVQNGHSKLVLSIQEDTLLYDGFHGRYKFHKGKWDWHGLKLEDGTWFLINMPRPDVIYLDYFHSEHDCRSREILVSYDAYKAIRQQKGDSYTDTDIPIAVMNEAMEMWKEFLEENKD